MTWKDDLAYSLHQAMPRTARSSCRSIAGTAILSVFQVEKLAKVLEQHQASAANPMDCLCGWPLSTNTEIRAADIAEHQAFQLRKEAKKL